jgi:hypothetical protein
LTQDNSAIVRRFVDDVINQGKMGSAEEFVWEDVVEQVPLPGQGSGLEGMKDVLRGMRSAFPISTPPSRSRFARATRS